MATRSASGPKSASGRSAELQDEGRRLRWHVRSGARRPSGDRARGARVGPARPRPVRTRQALAAEGARAGRERRRSPADARARGRRRAALRCLAPRARPRRAFLHGRHARASVRHGRAVPHPRERRDRRPPALEGSGSDRAPRDARRRRAARRARPRRRRADRPLRRAAARHQLARASRQSGPRPIAAVPCSGARLAAHRGARPVPRGGTNVADDLSARALADIVVEAATDKKAEDILVMNVSEVTTIADLFVLCSGRGERQVQSIADGIVEKAKAAGRTPIGIEGYTAGRWILVDLGDVVVHAFVPEDRDLYKLERLWGDAPVVLKIE